MGLMVQRTPALPALQAMPLLFRSNDTTHKMPL